MPDVIRIALMSSQSSLGPRSAFTYRHPQVSESCLCLIYELMSSQTPSPLSSVSAPPHAFPTTYPPPLRPPSGLPPVKWPRTLAASSSSRSISTVDLDSLCIRFAKSLVIDENTVQPVQPKTSIFSLPDILKGGSNVASIRTRRPKSRTPPAPTSRKSVNPIPLDSPRKAIKPHQLSVPPPFPQTIPKVRPTSRKAGAPATSSSPKCGAASSTLSDPLSDVPPKILPPPALPLTITGGLDVGPCFSFVTSYSDSPRLPFDFGIGSTALTARNSPYSSNGPTTPPSLSSNLFSEPTVASPTPIQLSEPFLTTQFQPQCDFSPHTFLSSPFGGAGSSFCLPPGSFFPKNAFDADKTTGCPQPLSHQNPSSVTFFIHRVC